MIHPGRTVILISIRLALGGVFSIAAEPQGPSSQNAAPVRIGSKLSTDSVILAEIATQLARSAGAPADHLRQLGGSEVLFKALLRGDIDLYPEYTGTLIEELLHDPGIQTDSQIRAALSGQGIGMTGPLGFSNNYAIGMGAERAETLHIATLSDLRARPELKFGFSNEFMDRHDGWPLLRSRYGLPQTSVRGLDHDLAYRALADGSIDATDLYSADAEIAYYHLRVLTDDLHVFPQYRAVYLYRLNLAVKWPAVAAAMEKMAGQIDESRMISMSEQAKLERIPEATVAAHFLQSALAISGYGRVSGFWRTLGRRTVEHLYLVCISLAAAIVVAVPLGVISARIPVLGRFILGAPTRRRSNRSPVVWSGDYVRFEASPGDELSITYPLLAFTQRVGGLWKSCAPNLVVTYFWRGNMVVGSDPAATKTALFIGRPRKLPPPPGQEP